jgi:hypothetical protein
VLFGEELFGAATGFLCVGLICDVVALKHRPGPVARDFHDDTFGDARSPEVTNGGPAKIMKEQVWNFGSFASLIPTFSEDPTRDSRYSP